MRGSAVALAAAFLLAAILGDGIASNTAVRAAAPAATSEVNQAPAGGTAVPVGTHVTYTATVTLSAGQAQSLTIQLRGDSNIANRTLTCTSSSNGNADTVGWGGAPSCKWNGPVVAGTFTFVFAGDITGPIGDAVPNASSVVCTDTNSSNTCTDEAAGDKIALADGNGDVGPLSNSPAPAATSEVDQMPPGGTSVSRGTPITYTASVTLSMPQVPALTIQLRGDSNITNRTLTCTSNTNGAANVVGIVGTPSCMWNGPVLSGTFTFVFSGMVNGPVGEAIPDPFSIVCADTDDSNSCVDEPPSGKVPLADATGDVGPLDFIDKFRVVVPLLSRD